MYNLNYAFRNSGFQMRNRLVQCRKENDDKSFVYFIMDLDQSKLISWALVFHSEVDDDVDEGWSAYFYTRDTYRRKGFGTMLYNRMLKDFPNVVRFYPYDIQSTGFFDSLR